MHDFCMLNHPAKELGRAMALTILESCGNVVETFLFGYVMFPSCEDFAVFVDGLGVVLAVVRDLDADFVEREVLA